MDRYLYDPLYHYSENAGKRHRPLICFAACLAVGGDPDRAATAAAAIDISIPRLSFMRHRDEAELRRGEPRLHLTEGWAGHQHGDLALSMVNGPVVNDPLLEDAVKVRVIKELIAMTCRTVEGQAPDLG
ncbi:MAG: polyprenyl synthetase family protein [Eggerthella lenta]